MPPAAAALGYAVGEINRYNVRKLVLANPSLGNTPPVGYFRTPSLRISGGRLPL